MDFHFCISIEGPLKNWKKKQWDSLAKGSNMTASELKDHFLKSLKEGKSVLPMDGCDNFDYQKGCMGHEKISVVGG